MEGLIISVVFILVVVILVLKATVLVLQGEAAIVERLGRYTRTLNSGLNSIIPIIDRVHEKVNTCERMVTFPPQAVITEGNLTVAIDTVVTSQVNEPDWAIYGIDDYILGVEQITTAMFRDVVGGSTLEGTLTSRDHTSRCLRGELDEATARRGLRIARVELKAIEPPSSIQQSMEKQMGADREERAMILTVKGTREADIKTVESRKQARILAAEGNKHAAILAVEVECQTTILRAEGTRAATYFEAQGNARTIQKVSAAVKASQLTPEILAWQYLEKLLRLANKDDNTVWMIPSQFSDSLESFARAFSKKDADGVFRYESPAMSRETREEVEQGRDENWLDTSTNPELVRAAAVANEAANHSVDDPVAATAGNTPEREKNRRADSAQPAQLRQLGGQNRPATAELAVPTAPAVPAAPSGPSGKRDLPLAPGTGNTNAGGDTHSTERPDFSGWSRDPYVPENG